MSKLDFPCGRGSADNRLLFAGCKVQIPAITAVINRRDAENKLFNDALIHFRAVEFDNFAKRRLNGVHIKSPAASPEWHLICRVL